MPIDAAFAGLFATGLTKALDTQIGEKLCHHLGNATIKDEEAYRKQKKSREEKRHSSSSYASESSRHSSDHDRRRSLDDAAPRRRPAPAELKRHSSSYYNPEQRGSRRTGSRRKHRRPRRISDAELDGMAEEELLREESRAAHEEKMESFREAKKSYEP